MTMFARIIADHARRRAIDPATCLVEAPDTWRVRAVVGGLIIRPLEPGDLDRLRDFAGRLGVRSRAMFCPYPWADSEALDRAFSAAIAQGQARIDAMVIAIDGAATVAHGFLWKAGGNPHSIVDGVEIPELGIAVADAWQGRGLGSLLVRWLQAIAAGLGRDAVELTTAMENDAGWAAYRSAGFRHIGTIRTPLGVDVTAATLGQVTATHFRDERQMVWIHRTDREDRILAALARKRAEAGSGTVC